MTSELQRVAQELLACLDQMPSVANALSERARKCRDAAGFLVGFSSGDARLQAAIHHLDAAANSCDESARNAIEVRQKARDWAMSMVGNSGGGSTFRPTGGIPGPPSAPQSPSAPDPRGQAIVRRLPIRKDNEGPTRGLWIGLDGKESPLVSGNDRYQQMADEHARKIGLRPVDNARHVEIKFAMFMRERRLRDETIYINNRPCAGPWSCRKWLKKFLPPGARLTIHWPDSGPETYEGEQ